jgi:hypothetical protein
MRPGKRSVLSVLAFALITVASGAYAAAVPPEDTPDRPHSENMRLLGASLRAGAVTGPPPVGPGTVPWDTRNTDLAFWGKRAIQGRYDGFRVVDIRSSRNPRELAYFECVSPQGDVGVYRNLVFRSVDSPQRTNGCTAQSQSGNPTGAECAPAPSPCTGFEGIQIFDISDLDDIELVMSVPLDCGSHTHTVVPDRKANRVLIYNSVSGNTLQPNPGKYGNRCPGPPFGREDIVEVPLSDPASASVIGSFELGEFDGHHIEICHDVGVILGSVDRAACAGHPAVPVFDISNPEEPEFLYATSAPTVDRFHSAAWSWDGSILVTGWEPGGGTQPRCQVTGAPVEGGLVQTDEMKTLFFHDGETGETSVGTFSRDHSRSGRTAPCTTTTSSRTSSGTCSCTARTSRAPRSWTSPTPPTPTRSPGWTRFHWIRPRRRAPVAARTSAAATGRRIGTTGASTRATRDAASTSGT